MNKLAKIFAFSLCSLLLLPSLALAHGNNFKANAESHNRAHVALERFENRDDSKKRGERRGLLKRIFNRNYAVLSGSVTAVSATGFTFTDDKGEVYTVTTADAKIVQPFVGEITLSAIAVGDEVRVKGQTTQDNENVINASYVSVTEANTHAAVAKGTVTAVNGNNVTIESEHRGVEYSVNVNTSADTTVYDSENNTTTSSSIEVGNEVKVKGLWDEILNVLNAIKIKILFS